MTQKRLLSICALTILATACSDDSPPPVEPDAAVAPDAAPDAPPVGPAPTVSIAFDPPTVVAGESTTLVATFTDFELVDPRSGAPVRPNEGHFHVTFDDNPNYVALWEENSQLDTTTEDPIGTLRVRAVLVGSDHVELDPVVESSTTLSITAP